MLILVKQGRHVISMYYTAAWASFSNEVDRKYVSTKMRLDYGGSQLIVVAVFLLQTLVAI